MGPSLQGQCRAKGPKGKKKKNNSCEDTLTSPERARRWEQRPGKSCEGTVASARGAFAMAFAKTKTLPEAPAEPSPRHLLRQKPYEEHSQV